MAIDSRMLAEEASHGERGVGGTGKLTFITNPAKTITSGGGTPSVI